VVAARTVVIDLGMRTYRDAAARTAIVPDI
jgi:hypothetical protein